MFSILTVDDEVDICKMIASFLKPKGYEVRISNSGEKALEMIADEKPDVILMDLNMPGIFKSIRITSGFSSAIILSAFSPELEILTSYPFGFKKDAIILQISTSSSTVRIENIFHAPFWLFITLHYHLITTGFEVLKLISEIN